MKIGCIKTHFKSNIRYNIGQCDFFHHKKKTNICKS